MSIVLCKMAVRNPTHPQHIIAPPASLIIRLSQPCHRITTPSHLITTPSHNHAIFTPPSSNLHAISSSCHLIITPSHYHCVSHHIPGPFWSLYKAAFRVTNMINLPLGHNSSFLINDTVMGMRRSKSSTTKKIVRHVIGARTPLWRTYLYCGPFRLQAEQLPLLLSRLQLLRVPQLVTPIQ